MASWTLESIPWQSFDASRVDPVLLALAKTASLVEHNSRAYGDYLCEVFAGDAAFCAEIGRWTAEEEQHGRALRRWSELADRHFDFPASFAAFTARIRLPTGTRGSMRGSRGGELLARCVVESGTSLYYSCIRDRVREPVLRSICARIAADEFHHYRMFYDGSRRWMACEPLSLAGRLRVLLGRMLESEDDELAFAWHCSTGAGRPYRRREAFAGYLAASMGVLTQRPVERSIDMVLRAAGLRSGAIHQLTSRLLVRAVRWRMHRVAAHSSPQRALAAASTGGRRGSSRGGPAGAARSVPAVAKLAGPLTGPVSA